MDAISELVSQASPSAVNLILAGTGVNGAAQVKPLLSIGMDYVNSVASLNIVSGSTFSYFVAQAHVANALNFDHFLSFDQDNRSLHGASFWKNLAVTPAVLLGRRSYYPNTNLIKTVAHIFLPSFLERTLDTFPGHLTVWAYCEKRNELVALNCKNGFEDMTVTDLIRAAASTKFLHGHFEYKGYQFSDPNFSPLAKKMHRMLRTSKHKNVVINYKKSEARSDTVYIKHDSERFPDAALLRDFMYFVLNLNNKKVSTTNSDLLYFLR